MGKMPNRRTGLLPAAVAAATAVVLVAPFRVRFPDCGPRPGPLAAEPVVLRVLVSSQKAPFAVDLFKRRFEATRPHVGSRCIKVDVRDKASGDAAEALVRGWSVADGEASGKATSPSCAPTSIPSTAPTPTMSAAEWFPDVWSPTSTVWVEQVRAGRRARSLHDIMPKQPLPPLAATPQVVAMPRRMAEALNWPRAAIGWRDIFDLARAPRGWESKGHPEWGSFRLGKTNPNHSISGLFATVGAYFAAIQAAAGPDAPPHTDLSLADLERPDVQEFVRGVESSVVYYSDTSLEFLPNLRRADDHPAHRPNDFVSALAVQETSVVEYNLGNETGTVGGERRSRPREPLAAVYPREGVLVADEPYVVLNAPWVGKERRQAAEKLLRFLRSDVAKREFKKHGFRLPDGDYDGRVLSIDNGFLPGGPVPRQGLTPPPPEVLDVVRESWAKVRKRARVLVAIDTSEATGQPLAGSGPSALEVVRQAAGKALDHFGDEDEVGLWASSPAVAGNPPSVELVPLARLADNRRALETAISSLRPAGGSRLAAMLARALDRLGRTFDPTRINGILVLSHETDPPAADDTEGVNTVTSRIFAEAQAGRVRVFPIAFGPHANGATARRIAEASGTNAGCGVDPSSIRKAINEAVGNL